MKRRWLTALGAAASLLALLVVLRLWPHAPLRERIPSSTAVLDAQGRLLRLTLASDQQYRLWTPLEAVSPDLVAALLLHEDRAFYRHPGVNPAALLRAALRTAVGDSRQGGSTLSMQLARLLYRLNTRSFGGKLHQIGCALWLELRYSKHDLLEAHLNLMPYGGNIQGVGAASLIYFGREPETLSLPQALALVLIPQSPGLRDPATGEPASLRQARLRLFASWLAEHPQAADQAGLMQLALHFRSPRALPFEAPHLTTMLLQQQPGEREIRSTLDLSLQRLLQREARRYVDREQRVGIRNVSAMLLDWRSMEVRAVLGSLDFTDGSIDGQVDGTRALRSPGSALKPFLYALALDQGLIHPLSVLKDAPTAFGPFSPENFDGAFVGPITARDALVRSRNIPAVGLAARLTKPDLYDFLKLSGVGPLAAREHYGLALALGGGEITMQDVVRLYALLANRGLLKSLRYRPQDRLDDGERLLSAEASFMVLDMLKDNPRPDDLILQGVGTGKPVAWKTGTSWGFRDAWSVGIFGPYVLAVWVGNFDGSSNPAFVGLHAAAPLFFHMVDAIRAAQPALPEPPPPRPPNLTRVEVCSASGDLPNADCPQTAITWFIPGKSPIRLSRVHRRLWVDNRTGAQACPPYEARYVRSEVFEFWPSDLQRLFAQAGMPRRRPPPPGQCTSDVQAGRPPAITSPLRAVTYSLRLDRLGVDAVPLSANSDGDVRTLHWFVDQSYVGSARSGAPLSWKPQQSGDYEVSVVDDRGRSDRRELRVAVVR
ncbi:MAG: penicillin-binding protein [Hydrocarboniphaga sp.]|uniref:penicillin-binding protein 1C n=1 Tax=Hydrocarboniphaga sp. TaxID=2033016 RepID=UPI00260525C0|nr:penicillin-binding protein 1C [Hydrocarboniphaga sp.]MDB5969881.1 penicillin-binding protein [Hydrocarboniphaga sp.]